MHRARRVAALVLGWLVAATLVSCGSDAPSARPTFDGAALLAKVENHLGTDPAHDQLRALVVGVGDRTVVEKYYDGSTADSVWDVESVTKSIVSTLVGIAIAEGKISGVDATLAELLPDSAAGMSRAGADDAAPGAVDVRRFPPGRLHEAASMADRRRPGAHDPPCARPGPRRSPTPTEVRT